MNAKDADCIVALRNSGKSWEKIVDTTGWSIRACRNAYKDRTNGRIYHEEWIFNNVTKEFINQNGYTFSYKYLVQTVNYPYSLSAFIVVCRKYNLKPKRSIDVRTIRKTSKSL